ncbi:MAG: aspartate 1-decarboxylase [Phycisphaerae bacterium]|jgi:aspartate 1-decarboxylase
MLLKVLRAKIHRATITAASVDYVGSVTIDRDLMDAAGIGRNECVLVADLSNGQRFETYVMEGPRGSGMICINGAAANLVTIGDLVIIMSFGYVTEDEARTIQPRIVLVDEKNRVIPRA